MTRRTFDADAAGPGATPRHAATTVTAGFRAHGMRGLRRALGPEVLDLEVWDLPGRLSDDDLYAEAGADRRAGLRTDGWEEGR